MEDPKEEGQNIDELKKTAPRVFIDGERLDLNYIRTEIQFVNYVRDRKEADVHVLITQQGTGSGGQEYTLSFIGLNGYQDLKNELKYYSNKVETRDEVRKGLVQVLKLGLASYVARTPISSILQLNINGKVKPTSVVDKWNFWVFSVSARGRLNGEKSRESNSIFGNVSVNRITPESKLRIGLSANIDESKYDYEDYQETSTSRSRSLDLLYAKSLGEHWSLGAFASSNHSTYSNIDLSLGFHPAIEYNIFPYSQSTRRQLRITYRIGFVYNEYMEETVYDKMKDKLWNQALSITLEFSEPWGNGDFTLEGSNFFLHHFEYTRFRVDMGLNLRIFKGLSLTLDGRYSALHDQLALRKGEATVEELLLRRTELASSYTYNISMGLSFSFGSVYSNVVNPRFGGGFGGPGGFGGDFGGR
jgi:hypothetical protein